MMSQQAAASQGNGGCRDESPDQGMLSVVKRVLLELHAEALGRFADAHSGRATPPWDVRGLLEELRSKVQQQTGAGLNNDTAYRISNPEACSILCPTSPRRLEALLEGLPGVS